MTSQAKTQAGLKQRELRVAEERNRIIDEYYSGTVDAKNAANRLASLKAGFERLAKQATANKDVALTSKYNKEIDKLDLELNVLKGALESGISDPSQLNVGAQSVLGVTLKEPKSTLPREKFEYTKEKDLADLGSKIQANQGKDATIPLIGRYNKGAPDSGTSGFFWDKGWTDNAQMVDLSKYGYNMGMVREEAKSRGITTEKVLEEIWEAGK